MKKLHYIIVNLSLLTLLAACGNPGEGASEHAHQTSQAQATASENTTAVAALKNPNLDAVYQQYQRLVEALIDGDANAAKLPALAIEAGAREIPGATSIANAAAEISTAGDLNTQRLAFARLNEVFISLVKQTGMDSGKLYIAHCPMALDDEGASWVTNTREIKNPYFGSSMLTCGTVTEAL